MISIFYKNHLEKKIVIFLPINFILSIVSYQLSHLLRFWNKNKIGQSKLLPENVKSWTKDRALYSLRLCFSIEKKFSKMVIIRNINIAWFELTSFGTAYDLSF